MDLRLSFVLLNLFNLFNCLSLKNKLLEENNIESLNATNPTQNNHGKKFYFIFLMKITINKFNSRSFHG